MRSAGAMRRVLARRCAAPSRCAVVWAAVGPDRTSSARLEPPRLTPHISNPNHPSDVHAWWRVASVETRLERGADQRALLRDDGALLLRCLARAHGADELTQLDRHVVVAVTRLCARLSTRLAPTTRGRLGHRLERVGGGVGRGGGGVVASQDRRDTRGRRTNVGRATPSPRRFGREGGHPRCRQVSACRNTARWRTGAIRVSARGSVSRLAGLVLLKGLQEALAPTQRPREAFAGSKRSGAAPARRPRPTRRVLRERSQGSGRTATEQGVAHGGTRRGGAAAGRCDWLTVTRT